MRDSGRQTLCRDDQLTQNKRRLLREALQKAVNGVLEGFTASNQSAIRDFALSALAVLADQDQQIAEQGRLIEELQRRDQPFAVSPQQDRGSSLAMPGGAVPVAHDAIGPEVHPDDVHDALTLEQHGG